MVDMLSAEDEREIRTSLRKTMSGFTDEYWMRHDMDHEFAVGLPRRDGRGRLARHLHPGGVRRRRRRRPGGGPAAGGGHRQRRRLNAGTTVQVGLFGLEPIVKHGSEEQKRRFLPKAAEGKLQVSFGVTEPDAGTETTAITTFAEKVPGGYKVNGRKVFISRAEQAERLLLITRTAPRTPARSRPTA